MEVDRGHDFRSWLKSYQEPILFYFCIGAIASSHTSLLSLLNSRHFADLSFLLVISTLIPAESYSPPLYTAFCLQICLRWTFHVALCVGLLALRIMFSRFIHIVACVSTSFFFCGWTARHCVDRLLFIHSFVNGHLGCFRSGAIMNYAAENIHVQVFM